MRQLINNPRFVLAMAGVAGLLFAWQYLPVDWGRRWESFLLGEAATLGTAAEEPPPQTEIPVSRLYGARPKNLPPEAEKMLASTEMPRPLFPIPASTAERKWQQQDEGPRFPAGLRLEAVYQDDRETVAVLSGNMVRKGDYLRGAEVVAIGRDRVTFLWNGSHHDLILGGDTGVLSDAKEVPAAPSQNPVQPVPEGNPADPLQGELERLRQLQKLLESPANLLKGSEQAPVR